MSDKWMNLGYDNQDLKPYSEPTPDFKDERRIGEKSVSLSNMKVLRLLCRYKPIRSSEWPLIT